MRNLAITWFLTGLWHGASWNYIIWGLYFFAFLVLERFVIKGRLPRFIRHLYALAVVFVGWVLFRFNSFSEIVVVIAGLCGLSGAGLTSLSVHTLFMQNIFLLLACVLACTNIGMQLRRKLSQAAQKSYSWLVVYSISEAVLPPLLLVLGVLALVGASYNPFIYFQF